MTYVRCPKTGRASIEATLDNRLVLVDPARDGDIALAEDRPLDEQPTALYGIPAKGRRKDHVPAGAPRYRLHGCGKDHLMATGAYTVDGHRDLTKLGRIAAEVLAELPGLHAIAREHWDMPLDVGNVLRSETQRRRVRFVTGGSSYAPLRVDEVDAIVHAAEHGYRLCRRRNGHGFCWLPAGHRDDCCADLWRWRLLYGQPEDDPAIMVVCSTCTPHRHVPRPADCPHGRP